MAESSVQYSMKRDERIKHMTVEEAKKYRTLQDMIARALENKNYEFSIVETSKALGIK